MLDQRPGVDRRPALGADVGVVDQVAGHQVDGAFGAREGAAEHAREGAQQRRLADADIALQQHVAAREHSGVDAPDHPPLPDHRLADLAFERKCAFAPVVQQRIAAIHAIPSLRFGRGHSCHARETGAAFRADAGPVQEEPSRGDACVSRARRSSSVPPTHSARVAQRARRTVRCASRPARAGCRAHRRRSRPAARRLHSGGRTGSRPWRTAPSRRRASSSSSGSRAQSHRPCRPRRNRPRRPAARCSRCRARIGSSTRRAVRRRSSSAAAAHRS